MIGKWEQIRSRENKSLNDLKFLQNDIQSQNDAEEN